jgi:multidrug efflux pump subunit AcrB
VIDLLVATVAFCVVAAAVVVAVVAVTVLPMYVALQLADRRRFSTARWVGVTAVGIAIGAGYAYVLHRSDDTPRLVALLPLLLTWSGPAFLLLLDDGQERLGGRAGRHE